MKKSLSIFGLLMVALMLLSACAPAAEAPAAETSAEEASAEAAPAEETETLKFAVVAPITGDYAEFGLGYKYAVESMADIWNEKGGLLGKNIEIVIIDDKGTAEESANVAQQVVSQKDDIVAVIGHFTSTESMAAAPIYQEAGMLQISPSSSHEDFTKAGDWIWRVSPLSSDESLTMSNIVVDYFKSKKVGMLILNNDWGLDSAELSKGFIQDLAAEKGLDTQIVAEETVVEGTDDYSSVITNFKNAGVDTILTTGMYTVTAPFLNQIKKVMPDVNVVGAGNIFVPELITIAGENAEGVVASCTFAYFFEDEASKDFVERYVAKDPLGKFPIGDSAQAFDTAGVIFTAIEKAGSADREKIREQLATIEYQGLSGLIKFNENRDAPRVYGAAVVSNGEWAQLKY